MQRPWILPEQVRDYSVSDKVKERTDEQLAFDIARAESYIIFHTHNQFDAKEYSDSLPNDVMTAAILLADAYAKQSIAQKDGSVTSETFDDYSYTLDTGADVAEQLNVLPLLDAYVLEQKNGRTVIRLRKL